MDDCVASPRHKKISTPGNTPKGTFVDVEIASPGRTNEGD
jgi:hypothetical protein